MSDQPYDFIDASDDEQDDEDGPFETGEFVLNREAPLPLSDLYPRVSLWPEPQTPPGHLDPEDYLELRHRAFAVAPNAANSEDLKEVTETEQEPDSTDLIGAEQSEEQTGSNSRENTEKGGCPSLSSVLKRVINYFKNL